MRLSCEGKDVTLTSEEEWEAYSKLKMVCFWFV
jgi:hypothetical protein